MEEETLDSVFLKILKIIRTRRNDISFTPSEEDMMLSWVQRFPECLHIPDEKGMYLLHHFAIKVIPSKQLIIAAMTENPDVIQICAEIGPMRVTPLQIMLLKSQDVDFQTVVQMIQLRPDAAKHMMQDRKSPLHLCMLNEAQHLNCEYFFDCLKLLLSLAPQSVFQEVIEEVQTFRSIGHADYSLAIVEDYENVMDILEEFDYQHSTLTDVQVQEMASAIKVEDLKDKNDTSIRELIAASDYHHEETFNSFIPIIAAVDENEEERTRIMIDGQSFQIITQIKKWNPLEKGLQSTNDKIRVLFRKHLQSFTRNYLACEFKRSPQVLLRGSTPQ